LPAKETSGAWPFGSAFQPSLSFVNVVDIMRPNAQVSDRGQPPMTFDYSQSEPAGPGSLHRLVGCLCGIYRTSLEKPDATASDSKHSPVATRLEPRCKLSDERTGDPPR
jgi:hypothetical protein